ncbi:MAG: hypothetical protein MUC50_19065 [Myxococcota bacterium]|jgi:hypothetical protein|nr:hypothetical protein [Myxococcota bacterium]
MKRLCITAFLTLLGFLTVGCSFFVESSATPGSPGRLFSCERHPQANQRSQNLQYHSFISMLDTLLSLKWEITKVDETAHEMTGKVCERLRCREVHVTVDTIGAVAFSFYPEGYGNWERNIRSRFGDISCNTDEMIESRIAQKGFSFSKPKVASEPQSTPPEKASEPSTPPQP